MTNWQIARYLLDAKKAVDSLWYIAANAHKINGSIKKLVNTHRNEFYINAAAVVDKLVSIKEKGFKKALQNQNRIINQLYYYRDKHAAHKDDDFKDTKFSSLMEIVNECVCLLKEVKSVCKDVLPNSITLNFVCYDAELFRNIYGINREIEEEILTTKHPLYNKEITCPDTMTKKIFNDTEDLWDVTNKEDYCTVVESGLTFDEGLQNLQDWCVQTNVLYGTNMWATRNEAVHRSLLMSIKLGYMDVFGRVNIPIKSNAEYERDMKLAEAAEQYLVFDLHVDDAKIKEAIYGR